MSAGVTEDLLQQRARPIHHGRLIVEAWGRRHEAGELDDVLHARQIYDAGDRRDHIRRAQAREMRRVVDGDGLACSASDG